MQPQRLRIRDNRSRAMQCRYRRSDLPLRRCARGPLGALNSRWRWRRARSKARQIRETVTERRPLVRFFCLALPCAPCELGASDALERVGPGGRSEETRAGVMVERESSSAPPSDATTPAGCRNASPNARFEKRWSEYQQLQIGLESRLPRCQARSAKASGARTITAALLRGHRVADARAARRRARAPEVRATMVRCLAPRP